MYRKATIEEDTQRVLTMDRWYILDGRHRKDHPLYGSYSGLEHIGPLLDQLNEMED